MLMGSGEIAYGSGQREQQLDDSLDESLQRRKANRSRMGIESQPTVRWEPCAGCLRAPPALRGDPPDGDPLDLRRGLQAELLFHVRPMHIHRFGAEMKTVGDFLC